MIIKKEGFEERIKDIGDDGSQGNRMIVGRIKTVIHLSDGLDQCLFPRFFF